jgi:CP family cyanate transporter-like MFS transporter
VLVATIFLVALCLRPAITAVGPVIQQIGDDLHLDEGSLGLLGALPLLGFAAVSPIVHLLAGRRGPARTIVIALLVLAAGILIRSYTGAAGLWIGTAVIGASIAFGNVLVPAIVKRDYVDSVSRATGIYSAFIGAAAATASVVAVPLAALGGWRTSLSVWAILAVGIALIWSIRARRDPLPLADPVRVRDAGPSVWRSSTAWLLTAFMGLQSIAFYVLITWLPSVETADGLTAGAAGLHLFLFQAIGILGGLAIPLLMRRRANQSVAAATASGLLFLGLLGVLFFPQLDIVWVVVAGLGSGASLVVALALIGLRGRTHVETTKLSGMAQSVGYLFAAAGPFAVGVLAQNVGWTAPVVLMVALAGVQVVVGLLAGRDRRLS